jgi:hypothetical protein
MSYKITADDFDRSSVGSDEPMHKADRNANAKRKLDDRKTRDARRRQKRSLLNDRISGY